MSSPHRCHRCHRRLRNATAGWNAEFTNGQIVWLLCPDCQTPEENAEAEINEATLEYGIDPEGHFMVRPKTGTA